MLPLKEEFITHIYQEEGHTVSRGPRGGTLVWARSRSSSEEDVAQSLYWGFCRKEWARQHGVRSKFRIK